MLVQTCQRALAMVFALAGCFTCCGVFGSDVWADLRIETTVQVGNDGSTSNNLTLFTNAGVYDYASDTTDLKPTGITFFNPSLATVTVLDPGRQKQLTLRIQQLDAMVREKLRVPSSGAPPWWMEMSRPMFQVNYDGLSQLLLQGELLHYRVTVQNAMSSAISDRYREFADIFAKLNGVLHFRPPQARIELNTILSRYHLMPLQVDLEIHQEKTQQSAVLKAGSIHEMKFELTAKDRQMIRQVDQYQSTFQQSSIDAFRLYR
ncbi:MAG: hypothetical protein CMJ62_17515 [Planctomycetaceae bacterium]|nr:hypothetical protein [Planctomycetaceae bacterium]